jgi:SAM-dependent methyltransferase
LINYLHSRIYRPERGWDPVPRTHALALGENEWRRMEGKDLDRLAARLGGLKGKRILDLGGGAGQYAVAFARRGASVVWHDVSANYRDIVREKAADHGVQVECSLGYMEDASRFGRAAFDVVFCRICWSYCRSDRSFARLIFDLIRPGGVAYLDVPTSRGRRPSSRSGRVRDGVYQSLRVKIGHPYPVPGRVPGLFAALKPSRLEVDFTSGMNERIVVVK